MNRRFGTLRQARQAIAALEFALIAPVFGILIIVTFDIAKGVILWSQVQNTAHLAATSATNVSVINSDRSTTLSAAAAQQSMSVVYAEMPWLRSHVEKGQASVTLTSVEFTPTSPNCTQIAGQSCYIATVAWSAAYAGGQSPFAATQFVQNASVLRNCGPLIQTVPGAPLPPLLTAYNVLPTANVSQPDAILVADVQYIYTPIPYLHFLSPTLTFSATYYTSVRIGPTNVPPGKQFTNYNGSAAGNATGNCPNLP